jgi:hypothetical protein
MSPSINCENGFPSPGPPSPDVLPVAGIYGTTQADCAEGRSTGKRSSFARAHHGAKTRKEQLLFFPLRLTRHCACMKCTLLIARTVPRPEPSPQRRSRRYDTGLRRRGSNAEAAKCGSRETRSSHIQTRQRLASSSGAVAGSGCGRLRRAAQTTMGPARSGRAVENSDSHPNVAHQIIRGYPVRLD